MSIIIKSPKEIFWNLQQFIPLNKLHPIGTAHSDLPDKSLRGLLFQVQREVRDIVDVLPLLDRVTIQNENVSNSGSLTTAQFIRHVPSKVQRQRAFDWAVDKNRPDIVLTLLREKREVGINPSAREDKAILWASLNGHVKVVTELLNHRKLKLGTSFSLAFQLAVLNGQVEVVRELIILLNSVSKAKINEAIVQITKKGLLEIVKVLKEQPKFDPDLNPNVPKFRTLISTDKGQVEVEREIKKLEELSLEEFGENFNIASLLYMLLREATKTDHLKVVMELYQELVKQPKVDRGVIGYNMLCWAAINGEVEIIRLILKDSGVAIVIEGYKSPLVLASMNHEHEVVKLLLKDKRIDPSAQDNRAIKEAAAHGAWQTIRELLKHPKVDPSTQDNLAIKSASGPWIGDSEKSVKVLLTDKRVDPSAENDYALRKASKDGSIHVVKLLLTDKRVDPSVAIEGAKKAGHSQIVKLLEDAQKSRESSS